VCGQHGRASPRRRSRHASFMTRGQIACSRSNAVRHHKTLLSLNFVPANVLGVSCGGALRVRNDAVRRPPRLTRRSERAVPPTAYPLIWINRRVDHTGLIRWKNNSQLFLSHTLHGETIGLEEIDEGVWSSITAPSFLRGSMNRRGASMADPSSDSTSRTRLIVS